MFGKKKVVNNIPPGGYHCAVCGLDCRDQNSLQRHVNWAHPLEKKQGPPVAEKKA